MPLISILTLSQSVSLSTTKYIPFIVASSCRNWMQVALVAVNNVWESPQMVPRSWSDVVSTVSGIRLHTCALPVRINGTAVKSVR